MTLPDLIVVYLLAPIIYLIIAFIITFKVATKAKGTVFEKPVLVFFVVPFFIFDWAVNITVMTVVCLDLPDGWNEVVTKRMQRYKRRYKLIEPHKLIDKWRLWLAFFLCNLANTVDEEHC